MMWFVRINGRFIGTVIAATWDDARQAAEEKFHIGWEDYPIEITPKRAKEER